MTLPQRKPTRLKGFDYNTNGKYFVTICTHNKKKILSNIVGDVHERPALKMTKYGEIVNDVIKNIPERFGVEIDRYIIMPNHIHMIVSVDKDNGRTIRELSLQHSIISNIVGYLKMNVSKQIHLYEPELIVWQRSYHDHIIRSESDYLKIWTYVDSNHQKWEKDVFYMP